MKIRHEEFQSTCYLGIDGQSLEMVITSRYSEPTVELFTLKKLDALIAALQKSREELVASIAKIEAETDD